MKLHALDGKVPMAHGHDQAVVAPGGGLEGFRESDGGHHQGVVASCHEGIIEPAEHAGAAVMHGADLAVDDRRSAHHLGTTCESKRLMTETNPEHGHGAPELADEVDADARTLWRPRSRRHHD